MLRSLRQKLARSLSRRGLTGTLRLIPALATGRLRKWITSLRPSARRARARDREFDRAMGIDTHGEVGLATLAVDSANQLFGVKYQPTPPSDFAQLMQKLAIDHARFHFIDIGAGKGRTLFLAALQPFARVIGVEFSPELCEIARSFGVARTCKKILTFLEEVVERSRTGDRRPSLRAVSG